MFTGDCSTAELSRNITNTTILFQSINEVQCLQMLNTKCYNLRMIKHCRHHGKSSHFPRKDGTYRCGKCASEWVINNRRKKKERLVSLFGGECQICGYKKYAGALDFHHLNRKQKEFSLSVKGLSYSWKSILKEARKCILLCKNCHIEVERGISKLTNK